MRHMAVRVTTQSTSYQRLFDKGKKSGEACLVHHSIGCRHSTWMHAVQINATVYHTLFINRTFSSDLSSAFRHALQFQCGQVARDGRFPAAAAAAAAAAALTLGWCSHCCAGAPSIVHTKAVHGRGDDEGKHRSRGWNVDGAAVPYRTFFFCWCFAVVFI